MNEKADHSITVNIPRPRVFVEDKKEKNNVKSKRIFSKVIRKPSEASLRKYSLPGNKPIHAEVFKDHLYLPYKLFVKKQNSIKHKQRLRIKLDEKYKIISTDLRKRLHVEDPPDDVHAMTDVDEGFFRNLNDPSLNQYIPLYKSLQYLFHKQLRIRQEVGYRRDCILNIETNRIKELEAYKRSVQRYMRQVKQFDAFVSRDYQDSMDCLQKWDEVKIKVTAKVAELSTLANMQFTIQSRLIGLDYMYFLQQKYGRFLYYLSPPSWRSKNREFAHSVEIEAKGFDLGTSSEEDTFNVIFEKMQNECLNGLVKPVLYFTHPSDLMDIFEGIEKHQLHHFTHVYHMAPHAKSLNEGIKKIKTNIEHDSASVSHMIKRLQKLLEFYEERESQLQTKFMKILHGLFYDSVAGTNVLKLQQHLEFCFEKFFAEKPSNMTLISTASALEKVYMEYSKRIDSIHNDKVKLAVTHYINTQKKKMRRAKLAARELRMFDRLEHSLLRAHEPVKVDKPTPLPVIKRPPIRKVKRQVSKSLVRASSQRELTEAEVEYLTLFTDWKENEDPANYLQSLKITDKDSVGN